MIRVAGGRIRDDTSKSLEIMGTMVPIGLVVVVQHTGMSVELVGSGSC